MKLDRIKNSPIKFPLKKKSQNIRLKKTCPKQKIVKK